VTTGENTGYGGRIPAVFVNKNKYFSISYHVNGNTHYQHYNYELNTEYHIEISQQMKAEAVYSIKVNGETFHEIVNKKPLKFKDVKLYLSDPWHDTFAPFGNLSNLKIITESTFNCTDLPESMNGPNFDSGCPGAVNVTGNPYEYYCNGNGFDGNSYPWWKQCCYWDGDKCQPTVSEYIVVQRNPVIVKGPYLDLQLAKDELKEIAKNGKSRMMLEIIDGALQVNPHIINGISQTPANGFDKYWAGWDDINAMVEIVKQHMETS